MTAVATELEGPQFVVEGSDHSLPTLEVGDIDRDRTQEYAELFTGEQHYAPVLALTVFTADRDGVNEILVGVRDPRSNVIHPNVVSTPTKRIDPEGFVEIASRPKLLEQTANSHLFEIYQGGWRWPGHDHYNKSRLGQMDIDGLLEAKLGIPPGYGWHTALKYNYAIHSLTLGDSRAGVTEDGRDIIEKVAMLNVLLKVDPSQKDLFPTQTRDYSDMRWVTPEEYRAMQDQKELLPVFDDLAAELCIHGVCIATSRVALDDMETVVEGIKQ